MAPSRLSTVDGIPIPRSSPGSSLDDDALRPMPRAHTAADKTGPAPRSRFRLRIAAEVWRTLQYVGICLHFVAPPRPPSPDFKRLAEPAVSTRGGGFEMQFYTPEGYNDADSTGTRFPVVVNFHGGGFTLGCGTDDARFARFVLERCRAVFVSVDYRLAPEFPFPTAVDDGADALLYVIRHAAELRIDPNRIATSGFSAGGNIAITAPLRLHGHLTDPDTPPEPEHKIVAVAAWYPVTDYTLTRAERRASAKRPDQTIPPVMTNLFDASYLFPADLDLEAPYLSPSKAPDSLLIEGLPDDFIMYTCEWDMLLREAEDFACRLAAEPICKNMWYRMVSEVPHGWDKGPSPFSPPQGAQEVYGECCDHLRDIFDRS